MAQRQSQAQAPVLTHSSGEHPLGEPIRCALRARPRPHRAGEQGDSVRPAPQLPPCAAPHWQSYGGSGCRAPAASCWHRTVVGAAAAAAAQGPAASCPRMLAAHILHHQSLMRPGRCYKLGKNRFRYNQVELQLGNGGGCTAAVRQCTHVDAADDTEDAEGQVRASVCTLPGRVGCVHCVPACPGNLTLDASRAPPAAPPARCSAALCPPGTPRRPTAAPALLPGLPAGGGHVPCRAGGPRALPAVPPLASLRRPAASGASQRRSARQQQQPRAARMVS